MQISPRIQLKKLMVDAPSLMVACGLAMRRFDPMSARINLLPHREERRKRAPPAFRRAGRRLPPSLGVADRRPRCTASTSPARSRRRTTATRFLKSEIAKLDKEIDEIKKLKDEIAALLARKQIIETLQTDRAQTVDLLDQLVRQMPDGVYLKIGQAERRWRSTCWATRSRTRACRR